MTTSELKSYAEKLGERLTSLMDGKGLTAYGLAQELKKKHKDRFPNDSFPNMHKTIRRLARGAGHAPAKETIRYIAEILEVSPAYLEHGEEETPRVVVIIGGKKLSQDDIERRYQEANEVYRKEEQDIHAAITRFERLIALLENSSDPFSQTMIAKCKHRIGICYGHYERINKGMRYHQEAQTILDQLGTRTHDSDERWKLLNSASTPYLDAYDYKKAESLLLQCLKAQKDRGRSEVEMVPVKGSLGQLYAFWGQFGKARRYLTEAFEGVNQTDKYAERARESTYLGMLAIRRGEFPQAEKWFNHSQTLVKQLPQVDKPINQRFVFYYLTRLYTMWGLQTGDRAKFKRAVSEADKGLALYAPQYETPRGIHPYYPKGLILRYKGLALAASGRPDEAIDCLKASHAYFGGRREDDDIFAAVARLHLATLYLQPGQDPALARAETEQARMLINRFADTFESARRHFMTGLNELDQALSDLKAKRLKQIPTRLQGVIDLVPY